MSSRRKGVPAKRIDNICSKLNESGAVANPQADTEKVLTNGSQEQDDIAETSQRLSAAADSTTDRPEGVYFIEPEDVDDKKESSLSQSKLENSTCIGKNTEDTRKRSNVDDSHAQAPVWPGNPSGLDLSVKRPKYDSALAGNGMNFDKVNNIASNMSSPMAGLAHLLGNESMGEEQMRKYHELPRLLASGKNILEAISEVGLDAQQFVALNFLNQFNTGEAKINPTPSDAYEGTLKLSREDFLQQQKQMATLPHAMTGRQANLDDIPHPMSLYHRDSVDESNASFSKFLYQAYSRGAHNQNGQRLSKISPSDRKSLSQIDGIAVGTVSSGVGSIKRGTLDPSNFDEDVFDQYITKFSSTNRCGILSCQYYSRDHYHCTVTDCNYQRFTNKADVIRHYNMHKKRDNSLAHGFLRYSPTDDCSVKYPDCHLNGKSTHYHCMQEDCNKVYTSTSDVMTHENFHKKYMQFVCSGFKRFRATETCNLESCVFRFQKTTHFHCTRPECNFTFKNKCDIEKHKTYHARDDQYISKGFKKYYKSETCGHASCVWSQTSNHFHCLRRGCTFSFTSTSQMDSHIRKHEKNTNNAGEESNDNTLDNSRSMRQISLNFTSPLNPLHNTRGLASSLSSVVRNSTPNTSNLSESIMESIQGNTYEDTPTLSYDAQLQNEGSRHSTSPYQQLSLTGFGTSTPTSSYHANGDSRVHTPEPSSCNVVAPENEGHSSPREKPITKAVELGTVSKYFVRCVALKCNFPDCELYTKDHFHCMVEGCGAVFSSDITVVKHTRFHLNLELIGVQQPIHGASATGFLRLPIQDHGYRKTSNQSDSDGAVEANSSKASSEVDQNSFSVPLQNQDFSQLQQRLLKAMLPQSVQSDQSDLARSGFNFGNLDFISSVAPIAASTVTSTVDDSVISSLNRQLDPAYTHYGPGASCTRNDCKYLGQNHWHCMMNRCRYVCKSLEKAQSHRIAHDSLSAYARSAKDNFKSYTMKKPCPYPGCEFKTRGHYHCLKPGCSFATIGTSKLPWHIKKHEKIAMREAGGFKHHNKKEPCLYPGCKYSGLFSHYHCIRKNCSYAFQYKHQMSTHVRRHLRRVLCRDSTAGTPETEMDGADNANLESGDDNAPLVIDEMDDELASVNASEMDVQDNSQIDDSVNSPENESNEVSVKMEPQDGSYDEKALDLTGIMAAKEPHVKAEPKDTAEVKVEPVNNKNINFLSIKKQELTSAFQPQFVMSNPGVGQFSKFKVDENILDGFEKHEASVPCGDVKCPYQLKAAHFHCTMENCGYRFTGRSHMFKHYQHHQRVATLVRDDFKRYKQYQPCGVENCEHALSSTHFHCLRCDFTCSDSAKVGTHRRQHNKADALQQSGFKRIRGKDDCGEPTCKYRHKNTSHFHCLQCSHVIVGLSGLGQHAERHKRGLAPVRRGKAMSLPPQNVMSFAALTQLGMAGINKSLDALSASASTGADMLSGSPDFVQALADVQSKFRINSTTNSNDLELHSTPVSPAEGSDNGRSNQSSPFLPGSQSEPGRLPSDYPNEHHDDVPLSLDGAQDNAPEIGSNSGKIISNYALFRSSQSPMMVGSPASSNSMNRVTEGIGT